MKPEVFVGIEVDSNNAYHATHLVVNGVNVAYSKAGIFYDSSAPAYTNAPRRFVQFVVESLLLAGLQPAELHNVLWGWHAA